METTTVTQTKTTLWNSPIDCVARICTLIGIFFIPISITCSLSIIIASVLTLFGGHLKEKVSIIFQYTMNWIAVVLIIMLAFGMFHNVISLKESWPIFLKYSHKIFFMLFIIPLFLNTYWRQAALNTLIASAIFTSVLMIFSYLKIIYLPNLFNSHIAIHVDPISLSILTAFVIFLLTNRVIDAPKRRILNTVMTLFLIFFLYYINIERTGMIIGLTRMALLLIQRLKWKGLLATFMAIPIMATGLYVTSTAVYTRTNVAINDIKEGWHAKQQQYTSLSLRIAFAKKTIQLIKQRPWFGYGTGSFPSVYKTTRGPMLTPHGRLKHPHNSFLHIAMQIGLIGLAVFLVWLISQYIELTHLPKPEQYLAMGLLITFTMSCLSVSAFLHHHNALFYMTFAAILFASKFDPQANTSD